MQLTVPLIVLLFSITRVLSFCREGYSPYNGDCWQFQKQPANYFTARVWCQNAGGNLASIRNADEFEFVKNLVSDLATPAGLWSTVWIGAWYDTTKKANGQEIGWKWEDGSPFRFAYWNRCDDDPCGSGYSEKCGVLYNDGTYAYNDYPCMAAAKNGFICRQKATTSSIRDFISASGRLNGIAIG